MVFSWGFFIIPEILKIYLFFSVKSINLNEKILKGIGLMSEGIFVMV